MNQNQQSTGVLTTYQDPFCHSLNQMQEERLYHHNQKEGSSREADSSREGKEKSLYPLFTRREVAIVYMVLFPLSLSLKRKKKRLNDVRFKVYTTSVPTSAHKMEVDGIITYDWHIPSKRELFFLQFLYSHFEHNC